MSFTTKYIRSLNSTDLRDDQFHHQTDALQAAALADGNVRRIGSLLSRVKYANTLSRQFEDGAGSLPQLVKEWRAITAEKGRDRKWTRTEDIAIAHILYVRVADASLAHYLDSKCKTCGGTGTMGAEQCFAICGDCGGTREAKLSGLRAYEEKLVMELYGELMELESSHAGAANALLRKD